METQANGVGAVENMIDPDAVRVSPDGLNVYVAGDSALTVFRRQSAGGKLTFVESEQGQGGGASFQLRDVVVSPDSKTVYVTSHLENAVAVLDRDAGDQGTVTVAQVLQDGAVWRHRPLPRRKALDQRGRVQRLCHRRHQPYRNRERYGRGLQPRR